MENIALRDHCSAKNTQTNEYKKCTALAAAIDEGKSVWHGTCKIISIIFVLFK